VYRKVRKVLSTSPPYARQSPFLSRYRDRVHVVPLGLDLEPYLHPTPEDRQTSEELKARYSGPIWLACGRLTYYKGLHNAMRALARVPGTLLVVGDGPERAALEVEARRNGVFSRVVFVGELPTLRRIVPYYHAATALWFPSNYKSEAFGLVQVEAMASGCPVLNTAIAGSGVPWVSRHDESGLTVPVDDPAGLARAARRLLDEPGLRERLAEGARQRARRDFDHKVMADRSVEVYRDALLARAPAGPGEVSS
jgi:rhamnosyl/mannosyltransferase